MARRLSTDLPFTCVTCEVEIVGSATFHVGLPFCCAGCVANGPCTCSYDGEPEASRTPREATVTELAPAAAQELATHRELAGVR
jgi:hypothetical protein